MTTRRKFFAAIAGLVAGFKAKGQLPASPKPLDRCADGRVLCRQTQYFKPEGQEEQKLLGL